MIKMHLIKEINSVDDIPLGVYTIDWGDEGSSNGVIYQNSKGIKYIVCSNWIAEAELNKVFDSIKELRVLK